MPFKCLVDKGICEEVPNMFDTVDTSVFLQLLRQQAVRVTSGAQSDKLKFELQI